MTGQLLVLLGYLLFMASHGFSQAPARSDAAAPIDYETARLSKVVTAIRITEKITIDGLLEEPAWKDAIAATGFVQQQPFSGQPATKETEVRFLYDDDSLYASFICFDSEPTLVNDIREDYGFQETDGVSLVLDTLHDGRSGFTFGANPAGGHRDSQISDDSVFNNDWDGVFEVKVSTNSEGWIAEFRIPFKTVRFSNSPTQEWGVNLLRRIARNNESSYWAPIPVRYNAARVSLAGTLKGLENIHQGRNLKVKPFVTAGIAQSRPAGDPSGTFLTDRNSDGGVDVKYSLTPSLTLDTTYHTDFAQVEVDQQQVNLTRFSLFLAEKRDFFLENSGIFGFGSGNNATNLIPFFSRRIGLSDTGAPIPILGGARVSGQINRYDVGFLAMKTESQDSRASNTFWVGRIKRKILTNSWFGALATSRDSTTPGDHNHVYGADAHIEFSKLYLDNQIIRSETPGAIGQDQNRKFGAGWRDDELVLAAEYNTIQPNFNPEVGFVRRRDVTQYSGDVSWSPYIRRSNSVRNLRFGTTVDYFGSASTGQVRTRTHHGTIGVQFQNNGAITFELDRTFDRLTRDERILGIRIPQGDYAYRSYSASANSNRSAKLSGNIGFDWGEFWNGNRKSFRGGFSLKPSYRWNADLTYSRDHVSLVDGRSKTTLLGSRFTYAFSGRAFLNGFVQYNSASHQVSSNIRFNITHHPLSDLYLVYNDVRDTYNNRPVQRAFIVKLTNLFNF